MIGLVDRTTDTHFFRTAWPVGWESDPKVRICMHHEFEAVNVLRPGAVDEVVVRCSSCSAPRCGHSTDPNPCMRIRHHHDMGSYPRDKHVYYHDLVKIPDLTDRSAVEEWLDA